MAGTLSTEESQQLRIHLLGGFKVRVGPRLIAEAEWRRRKAKSLVKLLALAPDHRLHREQVMDRLWPELGVGAAANNLHQVLHIARHILDPTGSQGTFYLHLADEVLRLSPHAPPWVDVTAFEAAAGEARRNQTPAAYQAALALYSGDLLPEDRYEEWLDTRREHLRQEYLNPLQELAQLFETQNELLRAIPPLQQLLVADPAHEAAHSRLMGLYARTDQRQQALRQYQQLKKALWQELEAEPEPATQQFYEDILAGRYGPAEAYAQRRTEFIAAPVAHPPAPLHNLPTQLTRFIGRERAKVEVRRLQGTTRLLTLTGPGGTGKSRLAFEVGTELQARGEYADGVWLVELAALAEPALVPQAVATVLGLQESGTQPLTETLLTHLQTKQLLILLDNCEHLIVACAQLAEALLRACPNIGILATSREPLHIPGELIWPVPPLSLPNPQQLPPLEELVQYEAVQLMIDRATAILPNFTVTRYNAPELAQLCHQLDGLPLAIELAAARVRVLTVAQINARLEDRFRLLVGGNRLALTRQQTLKATLDWSYELLAEAERLLFRRLAVFAGSFSLEAAEAICAGEDLASVEIMEVLSQLVDKSLVMVREAGQERRYSLLETMRQYGAEKLTAAGEVTRLRTRHQEWYLALAQQAEPDLYGPQQVVWLERLEPELDNLRAALAWRDPAEAERWLGLRLARALFWFFYPGRYLSEGRAWFEKALAETSPGQRTWVRAMALYGGGILAMYQGDLITANERLTESSTIWRTLDQANLANPELNSRQELAMALFGLGTVRLNQGDESTAQTLLEECLESFQALGQETLYGIALMHLGDVALGQGDWATARICYQACLTIQRKLAYHWGMAQALNNLGEVARCQADYAQAAQFYRESQALFQQLGSGADVARSMHNLGYVALAHDQAPGSASRLTPWPRLAGSRTGLPTSHLGRRETQQKPNSLPHDPSPGEG